MKDPDFRSIAVLSRDLFTPQTEGKKDLSKLIYIISELLARRA